jgi:N-acetylglucosamine-6-sulfatase
LSANGRWAGRPVILAALLAFALAATVLGAVQERAHAADSSKPNVIFILTDDQTLAEMQALPHTRALLTDQGTTFDRAYISYPLCCPSRATFLTGEYMHNTNVRGNDPPVGGWGRFNGLGTEAKALPVWLQDAGYDTVHLGKYLNGYPNTDPPVPPGWDEWYGKLSQYNPTLYGNQIYFNYSLLEQGPGGPPAHIVDYGEGEDDYQTEVLADKAVDAIHRLGGPGQSRPFFLNVWFSAPHAPYVAAARYAGAFDGTPVARNASINEKVMSDKPKFMRRLHKLKPRQLAILHERQRNRWAQLLSVDDAVDQIYQALSQEGRLDDTYIVFSSDNGYFAGEHRIAQGKYLPYEPSSHVPLIIRGPGIAPGSHSPELVSNADLAPTIAAIAGATPQLTEDGRSLLPYAENPTARSTRPILLEGDTGSNLTGGDAGESSVASSASLKGKRGVGNLEQEPIAEKANAVRAPAYRAIRTDRYLYVRYAGRAGSELYDMALDPLQLKSREHDPRYRFVKAWLATRLKALQPCAGPACSVDIGPDPLPLRGAAPESGKGGAPKHPGRRK